MRWTAYVIFAGVTTKRSLRRANTSSVAAKDRSGGKSAIEDAFYEAQGDIFTTETRWGEVSAWIAARAKEQRTSERRPIADEESALPRGLPAGSDDAGSERERLALLGFVATDNTAEQPSCGQVARDGWQPIETAPKDGTLVLVYAIEPARYGNLDPLPPLVSVCAWHPDAGFCVCEVREPTHWMPLPEPPQPSPPNSGRAVRSEHW